MVNKSQKDWVTRRLEESGEITRNQCLSNYISRLGAIIHIMKKEGWRFETFNRPTRKPDGSQGKDFVYKLLKKPND